MATYKKSGNKEKGTARSKRTIEDKSTTAEVFNTLDETASRSETWVINNQKNIFIFLGLVVAGVLAFMAYQKYVEMLLLEMRKLRGAVSLCFQDASSLQKTGIAQIILGQCQTKLIFPNPSAKREDYDGFDLNDSEWDYVMGNNDIAKEFEHTVLLKKPNESAVLNIDLSPLGPLMNLYLSGKDRVITMKNIQKQGGDQWVDTYLKS